MSTVRHELRTTPDVHSRPSVIDCLPHDEQREREALVAGLLTRPAAIPPKYFYDALGCALFTAICELPEYYPTRTERAIFEARRDEIAGRVGRGLQLVDLGAGDGRKAQAWFAALAPSRYVAVDIAPAALSPLLEHLALEHPALPCCGILADFTAEPVFLRALPRAPTLFFYPGSSIGNFTPAEAEAFVAALRAWCADVGGASGVLVGVDTDKDAARLDAAYDDALGVTAAFNRNVLCHVNRILDSDFDPKGFAHRAAYDVRAGRVDMHLEAQRAQDVRIDHRVRTFAAGERIHTESSYKYVPDAFSALLGRAGFTSVSCWQDEARDFAVFHAR